MAAKDLYDEPHPRTNEGSHRGVRITDRYGDSFVVLVGVGLNRPNLYIQPMDVEVEIKPEDLKAMLKMWKEVNDGS